MGQGKILGIIFNFSTLVQHIDQYQIIRVLDLRAITMRHARSHTARTNAARLALYDCFKGAVAK